MKLALSDEDQAFLEEILAFIDRHWPPSARRSPGVVAVYPEQRQPEETGWLDALVARGWSVPHWPVSQGGTGWTPVQRYLWDRETAYAETPRMDFFGATLLGPLLCACGSAEQRGRFLPPIREARVRWCQGFSEPGAGSDLASLSTRALRRGDKYVVNGSKTWVSGAHSADWMFCLVRTDAETARPQEGISFLLIDMKSVGIEVAPIRTLGDQHSVSRVTLTDVEVPVANLLGQENEGWACAKALLDLERVGVARVAQSQVELGRLKAFAGTFTQDGGPLQESPDFRRKVAEVEIDLAGLEALELRGLSQAGSGGLAGPQGSVLRLRGAEIGQRINELFVEALGYYGLPYPDALLIDNEGAIGHDYALPALQGMLSSRSWSVSGGTSEIHKNSIARALFEPGQV
jgi:alkylation response protein AidB-like acyl-CoA dehydrogenase